MQELIDRGGGADECYFSHTCHKRGNLEPHHHCHCHTEWEAKRAEIRFNHAASSITQHERHTAWQQLLQVLSLSLTHSY